MNGTEYQPFGHGLANWSAHLRRSWLWLHHPPAQEETDQEREQWAVTQVPGSPSTDSPVVHYWAPDEEQVVIHEIRNEDTPRPLREVNVEPVTFAFLVSVLPRKMGE